MVSPIDLFQIHGDRHLRGSLDPEQLMVEHELERQPRPNRPEILLECVRAECIQAECIQADEALSAYVLKDASQIRGDVVEREHPCDPFEIPDVG